LPAFDCRFASVDDLVYKAYNEGREPFFLILDRVTDVRILELLFEQLNAQVLMESSFQTREACPSRVTP
jgi:hypothetical protein